MKIMERVDWEHPPKKLRVVIDLRTEEIKGSYDDSKSPPSKALKMKQSLLETFASGSEKVNIMLSNDGPFLNYNRIKDLSEYVKETKGSIFGDRIDMFRHITYELVNSRKFS